MGSRGRSIRLRIYFLVAIPLIALVGLLAYIAGTLVNNAVTLDRAPSLINATGIPAAQFGTYVQAERAAAVAYLFQPTPANLQAYQAAVTSTGAHEPAFKAAMTSDATVSQRDTRRGRRDQRRQHRPGQAAAAAGRGPGPGPDRAGRARPTTARGSPPRRTCSWSRPTACPAAASWVSPSG